MSNLVLVAERRGKEGGGDGNGDLIPRFFNPMPAVFGVVGMRASTVRRLASGGEGLVGSHCSRYRRGDADRQFHSLLQALNP